MFCSEEWLNKLEVGDKVIVNDSSHVLTADDSIRTVETVVAITDTHIITHTDRRFKRSNGYVGEIRINGRIDGPVNGTAITHEEARAADARRNLARAEAERLTCKTCSNEVSKPWLQCGDCIGANIDIADHEAGEAILSRVLAGNCQQCGRTEPCHCNYVHLSS